MVLLLQVVHKGGFSSQVHDESHGADNGEAEAEGGDGAATDAKGGDEEEDDGTPIQAGGEIEEGEENTEVLRQYKNGG
jgi:hypothetical protein